MPTEDQIEAANRQEMDKLKGLIEDLNDQIKHLQVAADKHREKLDHALDRMKAPREILEEPKDSGVAETMFWLGRATIEEDGMTGDIVITAPGYRGPQPKAAVVTPIIPPGED